MTPKNPNLTAYDFLGYAVPGLAFLSLVDLSIIYHFNSANLTYINVCERYSAINLAGVIPLLLIAYLVGHVVSFCSSVLIERHSTWMYGNPTSFLLGYEHPNYFDTGGKSPYWSKLFRFVTAVLLLPVTLIDFVFTKIIPLSSNYITALDPLLVHGFGYSSGKIMSKVGIKRVSSEEIKSLDLHSLAIHFSLEAAPNHVYSLRNYVVLYGFLRSISLIFVVVFWILLAHLNGLFLWWQVCLWSALIALTAYILYAAFLKFRIRYHKEGIMAVIAASVILANSKDE